MVDDAAGQVLVAGPEVSSTVAYSSLDSSANALFLTQITFNQSGVLFAFIVHCLNLSPVRMQVWRPTNITTAYQLVCQHRVVPTVEDVRRRVVVSCASPQSIHLQSTTLFRKYTHSRFPLYLGGKCFDLHQIFRVHL